MTCLITGCQAFNGHAYVVGDLHLIGNCYVFNAVYNANRDTAWTSTDEELFGHEKVVDFSQARDCWERRATIIAPVDQVVLNEAAREYIA